MPIAIALGNPPQSLKLNADPPAADRRVGGSAPGNAAAVKSAKPDARPGLLPVARQPVADDHGTNSQPLQKKPADSRIAIADPRDSQQQQ